MRTAMLGWILAAGAVYLAGAEEPGFAGKNAIP
jgi:hypothetical protein